jgi:hypothetical protein
MHGAVMAAVGGCMWLLPGIALLKDGPMGVKTAPVHAVCTVCARPEWGRENQLTCILARTAPKNSCPREHINAADDAQISIFHRQLCCCCFGDLGLFNVCDVIPPLSVLLHMV